MSIEYTNHKGEKITSAKNDIRWKPEYVSCVFEGKTVLNPDFDETTYKDILLLDIADEIQAHTDELIELGFVYDNQTFGLTDSDITILTGPGIADNFPDTAPDITGAPYTLTDMTHYKDFYRTGMAERKAIMQQHGQEIARARAMTLTELQSWEDSRK
jgi:hypothetical protein